MGTCISLYLLYCLVVYEVSAKIHAGHIQYKLNFPLAFAWISGVFYFAPTVLTLFASSFKRMWLLGIAILASFAVAKIFYEEHLISVWCFFAAVISIAILGILAKSKSEDKMLKRI